MARFFIKPAHGSKPEAEYLEFPVLTNGSDTVVRKATDADKDKYAAEYEAFKATLPKPKAAVKEAAAVVKTEPKPPQVEAKHEAKHSKHDYK